MCLVIDIVCSEDSGEGHESGDEDYYCFIGTRSWASVFSNGVVSSLCAMFWVTNYTLDSKEGRSKKLLITGGDHLPDTYPVSIPRLILYSYY